MINQRRELLLLPFAIPIGYVPVPRRRAFYQSSVKKAFWINTVLSREYTKDKSPRKIVRLEPSEPTRFNWPVVYLLIGAYFLLIVGFSWFLETTF